MKLSKRLKKMIENAGFIIHESENNSVIEFEKCSSRGQDFIFGIDTEENLDLFRYNIFEYYNNFDVDYETYLWLDNTGHGKNGAPYDMLDVYKDMEECREFINELYYIVNRYIKSIRRKIS